MLVKLLESTCCTKEGGLKNRQSAVGRGYCMFMERNELAVDFFFSQRLAESWSEESKGYFKRHQDQVFLIANSKTFPQSAPYGSHGTEFV